MAHVLAANDAQQRQALYAPPPPQPGIAAGVCAAGHGRRPAGGAAATASEAAVRGAAHGVARGRQARSKVRQSFQQSTNASCSMC